MKNELLHTISGKSVEAECPEPIVGDIEVFPFKKRMNPRIAVEVLLDGDHVLIDDFYSGGLEVLNELKFVLKKKHPDQSFKGQRNFKAEFRALSHKVLILVKNHKLSVKKAPEIGWLKIFYPENNEFLLAFPQVQGLNSSWQWYQKGIFVPGLQKKIYPYYGTYFPTRFEHLELFNEYLKQNDGKRETAYDIGVGSGILSFQLLNNGFEKVIATDTNPNSIIGIHEQIKNGKMNSRIDLFHGDLFADQDSKSDLIVFNPSD